MVIMGALVVLGIVLLLVARIRACNHGGRVARALHSSDSEIKAKAEGFLTFLVIVGALCLVFYVWPLILILVAGYVIWKLLSV
jgi:hypothetical protein